MNVGSIRRAVLVQAFAVLVGALSAPAQAQEIVKIGFVGPYTGPYASGGKSYREGVEAWQALHGDKAGGKKVEVVYRDSAGADPTLAKRLAEELIVKDKVAMLGGFYLTPEAAATAPVVNAAKVPLFIVNASAPALMGMSPMFVRMGQANHQPAELAATYARQSGKSRAYVAVADYAPGHIVEKAFAAKFSAEGGQMVGNVRIPLNTTDFAPTAERIANANPDVLQIFLPPGAITQGFTKALAARGLTRTIMIIGQGEAEDSDLPQFDDSILGFMSVIYIDGKAANPENAALSQWLTKNVGPGARANAMTIGAFDAMRLMYKALDDSAGKTFNGETAVKALLGYSYKSPRGTVTIDPVTRENVQDFYLRQVVKEGDQKFNRVIKTWERVQPTRFN